MRLPPLLPAPALFSLVLALTGCDGGSSDAGSGDRPEDLKPRPVDVQNSQNPPPTFRREQEMMGTLIQITVVGEETPALVKVVEDAFKEMHRLEAVLSEWQADSEISRINAGAGKTAVKVSEDTMRVVSAGMEVARWSDGAFDLSWATLRGLYSFKPGEEKVPEPEELAKRLPLLNFRDIVVNREESTIKLAKKGMQIGTGGIAKGYALDRASAILKAGGIDSFMIFGGGQIQLHGKKGDRGWRVGIQHPRKNDYFAFLETDSGSVSTSGDYERYFMRDGKRYHHLLDPSTGMPVTHATSVTVVAEEGLYADAVSTAVFVMGDERALAIADKAPGNARFILLDDQLRVHMTPAMADLLIFKAPLTDGKVP